MRSLKLTIGICLITIFFASCFKDELLAEIDALRLELSELEKKNAALSSSLSARADSLSNALGSAQKRSDSLSALLKTKSDSISNVLGNTNSNLATLTKRVDSIRTNISTLNLQMTQLNSQLTSIQSKLDSLNLEMGKAGADLVSLSAKYLEISTSLQSINSQISVLTAEQASLLAKLNELINTPIKNPPTIVLNKIQFTTDVSTISEANLTNTGNDPILEKGICWSINPNPSITDSKTSDGAASGVFKSIVSGLSANTTYYLRAYAKNSIGVAYSDQISFKTLLENQITDVNGGVYNTVTIGTQKWMKENLKTINFNNGQAIPYWSATTSSGYAFYNNDIQTADKYGYIYRYQTVVDSRGVCPTGWHVPNEAEWKIMIDFLGGPTLAGDKLKEQGNTNWLAPSTAATNSTGFTALPGGARDCSNTYVQIGRQASFWSSDPSVGGWVKGVSLNNNSSGVSYSYGFDCNAGYVRCIKN
jgi:uncharacterized protein (TIGR02145 family)